jgi:hypothetical protein
VPWFRPWHHCPTLSAGWGFFLWTAAATLQHNLTVFRDRALISEATGQGRNRVWATAV